ncbi:MAG: hypothetical protein IPL49_10545 [Saprospirales bacterium]|nr:hypothetical protein [Saprospirales bacterium]MBK8491304.1 hypothetical protein [Saprospirales bacterium]
MKNLFLFSFLLLFAAMGCQTDLLTSPQDETLNLRAKKMVPFHSETTQWMDPSSGLLECTTPGFPFSFPIRFLSEGQATHLGHVTGWVEGYYCSVNEMGILEGHFNGAYNAANGDELHFTGVVVFNLNTGEILSVETEFAGGTGRWINATGWATGVATPTETPNVEFYVFDGEISAPGKK